MITSYLTAVGSSLSRVNTSTIEICACRYQHVFSQRCNAFALSTCLVMIGLACYE